MNTKDVLAGLAAIAGAATVVALFIVAFALVLGAFGLGFALVLLAVQKAAIILLPICVIWAFRPAFRHEQAITTRIGEIGLRIALSFLAGGALGSLMEDAGFPIMNSNDIIVLYGISLTVCATILGATKLGEARKRRARGQPGSGTGGGS